MIQPVPRVPDTEAGDVGGIVVSLHADERLATVMLTGNVVSIGADDCERAAALFAEAAQRLRGEGAGA